MENKKDLAYLQSPEDALISYNVTRSGITDIERVQRQNIYGKNILTHKHRISGRVKFLQQFKDLMIILLIVSALLTRYLNDTRTTIILGTLVIINACIGYFQEAKAERLLEKLGTLVHTKAKVIINGEEKEINSNELVPGDILILNEGDAISADLRIIEERNLQTNDFALTGESNPKRKHIHALIGMVEIADRTNLCYMGTTIATGNGLGVVINTGMNTELGRIAKLSSEGGNELSPLQKEMNYTAKTLTLATIILGIILFGIALILKWPLHEAILFAVGIAASMVPQGLPAQINIALTSATGYLASKFALVKKLSAVETLGAVNVICTDKTGTLTTNEMTVQELWFNKKVYTVTEVGYEPYGTILDENKKKVIINEEFDLFLSVGVLASNATIHAPDNDHKQRYVIGDPTEGALLTLAGKIGITTNEYTKRYPLVQEFCFDSNRKRMSMVRKHANGMYRIYVKGSLQTLLPCCNNIENKEELIAWDDIQANKAMRNLSYAYKDIPARSEEMTMEDIESGLTFLGMVSMIDPPRETVAAAIAAAKEAHIKIIIITGDYALTAKAIGERIGLQQANKEILCFTGKELQTMNDIIISNHLKNESSIIFSRVSPENKVRIVSLCKKIGWIVAVTGDGVNDAPALKQADIGVAMGKTGTDVAKEAADIILLDDSFATLVEAIRQGRIIYNNIRKNVVSCITTNWSELFIVLFGFAGNLFGGLQIAITAVQILAIDLIGEMGPLAALSVDPAEPGLMQQPARDTKQHILNKGSMVDIILSGLIMGICGYVSFLIVSGGGNINNPHLLALGQTTTYLTIILSQYVNIITRRTPGNQFFTNYIFSNATLIKAISFSLLIILVLFYVPFFSKRFGFTALTFLGRLCAIVSAFIYGCRRRRIQGKGKRFLQNNEIFT